MQLSQNEPQPRGLFWSDTGLRTCQKEALQPLVLEASDHSMSVTICVTRIKRPNERVQRRVRCNDWLEGIVVALITHGYKKRGRSGLRPDSCAQVSPFGNRPIRIEWSCAQTRSEAAPPV